MNTRTVSAIILALGLIIAALIHSGVYYVVSAGAENHAAMWRVNKFTGSVAGCVVYNCESVRVNPQIRITSESKTTP